MFVVFYTSPIFPKKDHTSLNVCVCGRQVTLVATAPLTNLAVAVQLNPKISKKLKALYIMGGNTECMLLLSK